MSKRTMNANNQSRRLDRAQAERLLAGGAPTEEGLEGLHLAVRALRGLGESEISDVEAQQFAAEAVRLMPEEQARQGTGALAAGGPSKPPARSRSARRARLRPAFAVGMIALAVMVSASAGVAYAADGAVPGDTLYGLDLALEGVGIGDGGLNERLNEASRLVERGQAQEGLDHAADSIAKAGVDDEALMAAARSMWSVADSAADNEALQSSEGRDRLAERLRQMASVEPTTAEFGQAVDELAGSLISDGQGGGSPGQGQGQPGAAPGSGDAIDGAQDPVDSTEDTGGGAGGGGEGQPR